MDAELIIILVAVGISIISGISKTKKKKAENERDHSGQGQHPREEEDPWATIRKYIEDVRSHEQEPEVVIPVPVRQTTHQVSSRKPEPVTGDNDPYISGLNEYAAKKAAAKYPQRLNQEKTGRDKASDIPVIPTIESNALIEDFDLRKAVIYSEILKPKYEEI